MINLLPKQQEKELKKEEQWKLTLILGIIFLVFLLNLFLIILSIKIYISGELEFQKEILRIEEEKFKTPETQEFQKKIATFNQNLSKLDAFYQGQSNLTKVLEKIYTIIPPEVYLTRFSWRKENSQISLSGFAPLREDLFELKKNIEAEGCFKLPKNGFPASNWVKAKEINFNVTFMVNL